MKSIAIHIKNLPWENGTRCAISSKLLKTAQSLDISEYECFECNKNSIGSFVHIENQIANKQLSMCDIQVYGKKIAESGNLQIIDYTNNFFFFYLTLNRLSYYFV